MPDRDQDDDNLRTFLERGAADGTPVHPLNIRPLQQRATRRRAAYSAIALVSVTALVFGIGQATLRRPDVALVGPGQGEPTVAEPRTASEPGEDVSKRVVIRRSRGDVCIGLADAGEACGFGVPGQRPVSVVREGDATGDYVYGIAAPEVATLQITRPGKETTTAAATPAGLGGPFVGLKYFAWKFPAGTGNGTTVRALDAEGEVVATDEPPPQPDGGSSLSHEEKRQVRAEKSATKPPPAEPPERWESGIFNETEIPMSSMVVSVTNRWQRDIDQTHYVVYAGSSGTATRGEKRALVVWQVSSYDFERKDMKIIEAEGVTGSLRVVEELDGPVLRLRAEDGQALYFDPVRGKFIPGPP